MKTLLLLPTPTQYAAVTTLPDLEVEVIHPETFKDDVSYSEFADLDLVVGAPPIWADDEDASYDEEFIQAIEQARPRGFVLETVRGLASPRNEHFLLALALDLGDLGYEVSYEVVELNGRKRLVIVGIRQVFTDEGLPLHGLPMFRSKGTTVGLIQDTLARLA